MFALMHCTLPTTSNADVLWEKSLEKSISGKIVSENDTSIQFQTFSDGRLGQTKSIKREQIGFVTRTIDTKRLSLLSPENWSAYRDYAEEIGGFKNDPAARHLARRLYLITAANSSGELQQSAILGLLAITESKTERRRLELLGFMLNPDSSEFAIVPAEDQQTAASESDKQTMLSLVHAIRKGESAKARSLLKSSSNRIVFSRWRDQCSLEELDQIAVVNQPSKVQLKKLLSIEIRITQDSELAEQQLNRKLSWGDYATQTSTNKGILPTFENVTEFNPNESIYENGIWKTRE